MVLAMFLLGLLAGAAVSAILLRSASEEKVALVTGNREQLAAQMKAISADALQQVSEHVKQLAKAQREADRATAAGELGRRTEEIKRRPDPTPAALARPEH